jgi:hypothetical protein
MPVKRNVTVPVGGLPSAAHPPIPRHTIAPGRGHSRPILASGQRGPPKAGAARRVRGAGYSRRGSNAEESDLDNRSNASPLPSTVNPDENIPR